MSMVPKQRHTKSRRNKRRSHHALKAAQVLNCPKCNDSILTHTMCLTCGYYKDRQVIDVQAKMSKREKKELRKQQEETAKQADKPLSLEELSKK